MIPKIIHQIWLGNTEKKPIDIANTKQFFEDKGWKYELWTEDELLYANIIDKDVIQSILIHNKKSSFSYAKIADICRYKILEKYGGFYIDADTIVLKDFDKLRFISSFVCGFETDNEMIANGIIGSMPKHYILTTMIQLIDTYIKNCTLYNVNAWRITGPKTFTRVVELFKDFTDNITILPKIAFYPIHHTEIVKGMKIPKFTKDSFCWTYWSGSFIDRPEDRLK